ncbi:MAG: TniQ family protein [Actinomycetota bacterium]|nr:TniQ family protein [Actinomycetota bacterium]
MPPSPSAEPADTALHPAAAALERRAARAAGLPSPRLIPAGYDLSALPLFVDPAPGEQLCSWLVRWALRYGLPVSRLLAQVGITLPSAPAARLERQLRRRHTATLTAAAGIPALPPEPDTGATESPASRGTRLRAQVEGYLIRYHRRETPLPTSYRYCPDCLAESGGVWLAEWSQPLHTICVPHRVLLRRCCPDCGRRRFSSPAWMTHDTPAWTCSEPASPQTRQVRVPRTRHPVCGRDLRTTSAEPASDADLATQLRLWDLAVAAADAPDGRDGQDGQDRSYGGFPASNRDVFDAALELTVERFGDLRPLVRATTAPRVLLDAVAAAFQVLDQPDADAAAHVASGYGLLHPAGPVTPIGPDRVLNLRPRNPLLASIRLATLHDRLSPSAQLVFRTGSSLPRYPQPQPQPQLWRTGADQAQLAWIPQLIWPGQLTPWIDDRDFRDRAAASMLLAKVGSTRPWRFIALDLGLPADLATSPASLVRSLKRDGTWPDVLARLDDLAGRLEQDPPPINYQARRWTAARYDDVIAAVNHTMAYLGPPHPWCTTHLLVELFWPVYTGGDLRLAAPATGTLLNPDLYHQHDHDTGNAGPLSDPRLLAFFTATAATLNGATDNAAEPLTWQPPRRHPDGRYPWPGPDSRSDPPPEDVDDSLARRWMAEEGDLSWAPPLRLPHRGVALDSVRKIVLAMAESPAGSLADQPAITERIAVHLHRIYGIDDQDALAELVPVAIATYQAVGGARHDPHQVDPLFDQQLRHTFTLDARPLVDHGDAIWDISHEWKPAPPRKPTPSATKRPTETPTTAKAAHGTTPPRRTTAAKPTRLDRLAANVHATRQRQLARRPPQPQPSSAASPDEG